MLASELVLLFYSVVLFQCCFSNILPRGMAKQDISQLLYKYIKPLAEKFPNHELEIQFELQPPMQRVQHRLARSKAYLHKPHKSLRGKTVDAEWKKNTLDYVGVVSTQRPQPRQEESTLPSPPQPVAVQFTHKEFTTEEAVTALCDTVTEVTMKNVEHVTREPVYKDELQKALGDLERRLTKNLLKGQIDNTEIFEPSQVIISNPGPVNDEFSMQNINRIAELIKKGVQFKRHLPAPGDDTNMEWMQIKIPKNLS